MDFNQTDIGLLIFYNIGGLFLLITLILVLPTLYKGPLKLEEAK